MLALTNDPDSPQSSEEKTRDEHYYTVRFNDPEMVKEVIQEILIEYVFNIEGTKEEIKKIAKRRQRAFHTILFEKIRPLEHSFIRGFYEREYALNVLIYFALKHVSSAVHEGDFINEEHKTNFLNRKFGSQNYVDVLARLVTPSLEINYRETDAYFEFNRIFAKLTILYRQR